MNKKMRDHCHYTCLYRGATHNNCNLKYRIPDHIPIVFHNLSGYDTHLGCERCRTKKTTGLDEEALKKNFNHQ